MYTCSFNLVHHKYFPVCHICVFRYTSGPSSDECESDSENEIADNFDELVFGVKDSDLPTEKEVAKKEDVIPKESKMTTKQTKVDSIAKNSTAIESESENGTKTTVAPKITKSRVPILSGGCIILIIWFL